jgi:hypothetical protein
MRVCLLIMKAVKKIMDDLESSSKNCEMMVKMLRLFILLLMIVLLLLILRLVI